VVPNGVLLSEAASPRTGMNVGPLSLSLSPSKGERVPFRAGEGSLTGSPSFHKSGRLGLDPCPQAGLVFGTAARINPRKRLEDLLEAFRVANGRLPTYTLKIAGGVERGCEDYAARLRAASDGLPVEWIGEMSDLRAFHRQLDAFVMVSEPAGCPNASLEAMAAGLTVIATDTGGASEQVIDGRTGRLVPSRDPQALAAALVELAAQPGLLRQMGRAGRDLIRDRFSLERMIADYRRICLPGSSGASAGWRLFSVP